ncbi:MAG: tyrosine-type recombinase/integrase [Acetobacteraceae bacterium]|nr:tyrosine-type recombinase/integrase [Acetobacteraceae bacterium]
MALRVVSEGPMRITKATVDAAWRRRAKGVRLVLCDADCRGLSLVVNPTGMTWKYEYRPRGLDAHTGRRWPMRGVTLGNPATHAPDAARGAANRVKGQAAAGADPAAERRATAEAARRRRAMTLGRLLDDYAKVLPTRPKLRGAGLPCERHAREDAARARVAVAAMDAEGTPVTELTPADVRRMLDADPAHPSVARARFGSLSRFLDWCQEGGHLEANPCALVSKARRPRAVPARAHFLTVPDLVKLWRAVGALPHPVWRDLSRFLIAVPCRRGEAAALDWSHLDLDAAEWRQPGRMTKNGEAHRLRLHPLALDLLRRRWTEAAKPRVGLVFPSPEAGSRLQTFSAVKEALDAAAGLTGWRWHDFRRSFATALGEAGVAEPVVDAVLNHRQAATRGGVLGVYQRAQRWPEQVAAMERWGEILSGVLGGEAQGCCVGGISLKRDA